MRSTPGNDLNLGMLPGRNASLLFPRTARDKHLYICGGTGTGKSKFLESLIRQDILAWRHSRCGMLVLDPHGSLYDSLIRWMAWNKIDRPVVPIDLRQDDWIVSYNLLRQRKQIDPAVLIDNITDAMAYVWGQAGTDQTPRFARWVGNIIRPLYERNLSIIDAEFLLDRVSKQMRYLLTTELSDKATQQDWAFANSLPPSAFEAQIESTVNRLQRFIRNKTMRAIFGSHDVSLDFGDALEKGQIVLVSLATERAKVSKENAELFATLLLNDLWTAAQERGKHDGVKPFYVYLDEFQRFVTPTIADNLDEARGYGLHLTMAHQFPNQLLDRGENGKRVYNSIMENASSKVVFRLTHEENLSVMAKWLFMGVMNPDEIKHELYSRKVMEYRKEMQRTYGYTSSSGRSTGRQRGHSSGMGDGGTENYQVFEEEENREDELRSRSKSASNFRASSASENDSNSDSYSESVTHGEMLVPVFGKELSHVQFRSLEEQLFRSMAVLFDQQQRQGVARLVGMNAPVSIRTPTVDQPPSNPERIQRFLTAQYAKYPFVLTGAEAVKNLEARPEAVRALIQEGAPEPTTARRKIRG